MDQTQNIDSIRSSIIDDVLKILRDQRDDKQIQQLFGSFDINPQIFQFGNHFVAGPIPFSNPYQTAPSIVFGQVAQRALEQVTAAQMAPTGYVPLIIHPYVYGFQQVTGLINGYYLGLYALTPVPPSTVKYTINWHAEGKGSNYPGQRIDEAWTSAYNTNEADFLMNDTGLNEN